MSHKHHRNVRWTTRTIYFYSAQKQLRFAALWSSFAPPFSRLKVARQTVSAWRRQYREQGAAGLRQAGRAGRKPLLDAAQRERLTSLLLEGPQAHGFPTPLWSCPRVARLIGDEFGVDYHEGHVWKILRALDWSPQRPVGKARERNEEQIRTWKRKTWTRIKKKPKTKAVRSSSSTKAD